MLHLKGENTALLCLHTKPVLKIEQLVGSLELITSHTIIAFKYQVGGTMACPDKSRTKDQNQTEDIK